MTKTGTFAWDGRWRIVAVALILGSAWGCARTSGGGDEAASAEGGALRTQGSPVAGEDLDATVTSLMESAGIPGLSLAVLRPGEPVDARIYGVKAGDDPVSGETVFEAASLSKPVFAYAVMRLVERGEIDLDVPIADVIEYPRLSHDPRHREITPRMVLSHTSGLPNWGGTPLEILFDPGDRFSYSGEGFVYLQGAVEHVTGEGLGDLVQREVFDPLAMAHSSYTWRADFDDLTALPHDELGRPQAKQKPRRAVAAATLHTTATDYASFLAAVMAGTGLESDSLRDILTPQVELDTCDDDSPIAGLAWGLGWGLFVDEGEQTLWHWGDNGPFKAFVVGRPGSGSGLVWFANSSAGLDVAGDLVESALGGGRGAAECFGYERHDDPARRGRIEVRRAFVDGSDEEGHAAIAALRGSAPEVVNGRFLAQAGAFLVGEDRSQAGLTLYEQAVEEDPDSIEIWDRFGESLVELGRWDRASEAYRQVRRIDPEDDGFDRALAWIESALQARADAPAVTAETMARYAGDYGPRHISLEAGTLWYQRDGGERYRLYAINEDTFGLEGLGLFRIRFADDEAGNVIRIDGLYANGTQDQSPRDGS